MSATAAAATHPNKFNTRIFCPLHVSCIEIVYTSFITAAESYIGFQMVTYYSEACTRLSWWNRNKKPLYLIYMFIIMIWLFCAIKWEMCCVRLKDINPLKRFLNGWQFWKDRQFVKDSTLDEIWRKIHFFAFQAVLTIMVRKVVCLMKVFNIAASCDIDFSAFSEILQKICNFL